MPRTLTAAAAETWSANHSEYYWKVQIATPTQYVLWPDATKQYEVNGSSTLRPRAVHLGVRPGRHTLNPKEFKSSRENWRVYVEREFWNWLSSTQTLVDASVTFTRSRDLGTSGEGLVTSSDIVVFSGIVEDYVDTGTHVEVKVKDPRFIVEGQTLNPTHFVARHPVDAIQEVLSGLGVTHNSNMFTDFATAYPNDTHYVINTWGNNQSVPDPLPQGRDAQSYIIIPPTTEAKAEEFIEDCARVARCVLTRRNGLLDIVRLDFGDAASVSIDESVAEFTMLNTYQNTHNTVRVNYWSNAPGQRFYLTFADATRVTSEGEKRLEIDMPYAAGWGDFARSPSGLAGLDEEIAYSAKLTQVAPGGALFIFLPEDGLGASVSCGFANTESWTDWIANPHWTRAGGAGQSTWPWLENGNGANYNLNATRAAIWMIQYNRAIQPESTLGSAAGYNGGVAIADIRRLILDTPAEMFRIVELYPHVDYSGSTASGTRSIPGIPNDITPGTFTAYNVNYSPHIQRDTNAPLTGLGGRVSSRSIFGTPANPAPGDWVATAFVTDAAGASFPFRTEAYITDVTALIDMGRYLVNSFSRGAPTIRIKVPQLYPYVTLEPGDVVSVTSRKITFEGHRNGVTDQRFRIVSELWRENGVLEFEAMHIPDGGGPVITTTATTEVTRSGGSVDSGDPTSGDVIGSRSSALMGPEPGTTSSQSRALTSGTTAARFGRFALDREGVAMWEFQVRAFNATTSGFSYVRSQLTIIWTADSPLVYSAPVFTFTSLESNGEALTLTGVADTTDGGFFVDVAGPSGAGDYRFDVKAKRTANLGDTLDSFPIP